MNKSTKAARPNVRAIVDGMNLRACMISPHYVGLAAVLREFADADFSLEEAAWESRKQELAAAYGLGPSESDKPFAFSQGVAIIPIHGVLVNRFSSSWGFVTGYNFIRRQTELAQADDDVKLIVYDCNSPGGMVAGCFETADIIFESRSEKPSLALVDASSYSACYALASSATRMVVTPTGGVGSIGVVAMHVNMAAMLKDWGIEVTFIYAGKHKVDGNPYEALPADVKASIQKSVDKSYATFVGVVSRNRDIPEQAVRDTEAQVYDPDDALALGLIDAVQTPPSAVAAYLDELTGSDDQQEQMMTDTTKPGAENANAATEPENATTAAPEQAAAAPQDQSAIAAASAQAAKNERARMAAIMGCDEAKDKSKLANHLALNTDMSAEAAKAVLAVAAPETAPAAATTASPFAASMSASANPEVGAGDDAAETDTGNKGSASSRILAAQQAATGYSATKH